LLRCDIGTRWVATGPDIRVYPGIPSKVDMHILICGTTQAWPMQPTRMATQAAR